MQSRKIEGHLRPVQLGPYFKNADFNFNYYDLAAYI